MPLKMLLAILPTKKKSLPTPFISSGLNFSKTKEPRFTFR
jgi:hypothetical protein